MTWPPALAHIANSGIFPAQSLKQGTKCRISTTSWRRLDASYWFWCYGRSGFQQ